ncbi:L-histidine N(alpha)-methyltransferase [Yunchengibacter salinarum]|uniref:L-histidine N(alpha)-methyltransferase n=1 Tax=Yunchengibacter salinarum TaxID=3133399 RepID=UPI0035B5F609
MNDQDSGAETHSDKTAFRRDVLAGLTGDSKSLPAKWLYDTRGSELFEKITRLDAYYLTRTERRLLSGAVDAVADRVGPGAMVVEYGAGASRKTRLLLDALHQPALYCPTDIAADFLTVAADSLRADYPHLAIRPHVGDFMDGGPDGTGHAPAPRLGFFPGSTIGNLDDAAIHAFLTAIRGKLGRGAFFLLGADLVKDVARMRAAYDDPDGLTARFNRNILHHINRRLGSDLDPGAFSHEARWNPETSCVEMHLVSRKAHTAHVADHPIRFEQGESIHTENSRKFTETDLSRRADAAGWHLARRWTDADTPFLLALFQAD